MYRPRMENVEDIKTVPAFQLQNTTLSNRCRDVFSGLDALEQKHQEFEQNRAREDADLDRNLIHQGPSSEDMETVQPTFKRPTLAGRDYHESRKGGRHGHERGEQQFRKPMPPQTQNRGRNSTRGRFSRSRPIPDHKLHPERWTEYSLEDVDVSDSANKKAAFEFLHERRRMREADLKEDVMDLETTACSKGLFTFRQPTKTSSVGAHTSAKDKSKPVNSIEKMEDDNDQNELAEEDLDCANIQESTISLKRKIENIDIHDEPDTSPETEKTSFKSRKRIKRSFRSQTKNDEQDAGE